MDQHREQQYNKIRFAASEPHITDNAIYSKGTARCSKQDFDFALCMKRIVFWLMPAYSVMIYYYFFLFLFYLPSIIYNISDHQFVFSRGRHIVGQDKQTSLINIDMLKCIYYEAVTKEDLSFILMLVKDKNL